MNEELEHMRKQVENLTECGKSLDNLQERISKVDTSGSYLQFAAKIGDIMTLQMAMEAVETLKNLTVKRVEQLEREADKI